MKTFFRIIFGLILVFSLILTLLFFGFRNVVWSADYLTAKLTAGNFDETVCSSVRNAIESKTMLFELGSDTFNDSVTDEEIIACADKYIASIASHFANGGDIVPADFTSDALYAKISSDLQAYAAENSLELEAGSADAIYATMCETASNQINMINSEYVQMIPCVSEYQQYVNYGYIFPIVAAIAFIILFLLDITKFVSAIYSSVSVVWIGAALGFIPTLLFRIYNFPNHIALGASPLKEVIRNATNMALGRILIWFGLTLLAASALIALAITMISLSYANDDRRNAKNSSRQRKTKDAEKKKAKDKDKKSKDKDKRDNSSKDRKSGSKNKKKDKDPDSSDEDDEQYWIDDEDIDSYDESNELYDTKQFLDEHSEVPEYDDPADYYDPINESREQLEYPDPNDKDK